MIINKHGGDYEDKVIYIYILERMTFRPNFIKKSLRKAEEYRDNNKT